LKRLQSIILHFTQHSESWQYSVQQPVGTLCSVPFKSKYGLFSPIILSIFKSEHAEGTNIGFEVNRFDDKMIFTYKSKYKSLFHLIKTIKQ